MTREVSDGRCIGIAGVTGLVNSNERATVARPQMIDSRRSADEQLV